MWKNGVVCYLLFRIRLYRVDQFGQEISLEKGLKFSATGFLSLFGMAA